MHGQLIRDCSVVIIRLAHRSCAISFSIAYVLLNLWLLFWNSSPLICTSLIGYSEIPLPIMSAWIPPLSLCTFSFPGIPYLILCKFLERTNVCKTTSLLTHSPLVAILWLFEWECPSWAHILEYLVYSWNCPGNIRKCGFVERDVSWGFTLEFLKAHAFPTELSLALAYGSDVIFQLLL